MFLFNVMLVCVWDADPFDLRISHSSLQNSVQQQPFILAISLSHTLTDACCKRIGGGSVVDNLLAVVT